MSNRVQIENTNTGTGAWRIVNRCPTPGVPTTATSDPSMHWGDVPSMSVNQGYAWGYASQTSVTLGSAIDFSVACTDPNFIIAFYRLGWYGGAGGRLMTQTPTLAGSRQSIPAQDWSSGGANGGVIDCNWPVSYRLQIPTSWVSGMYLGKVVSIPAAASTLSGSSSAGTAWNGNPTTLLPMTSVTPYAIGQWVEVGSYANCEQAAIVAMDTVARTLTVQTLAGAALTGAYVAAATVLPLQMESWIPFVVRDDGHPQPIVYKTNSLTWQAYNTFGGASAYNLYTNPHSLTNPSSDYTAFSKAWHSRILSYNRPSWQDVTTFSSFPGWNLHYQEAAAIMALERLGLPLSYCDDLDIESTGLPYLQQFSCLVSGGHGEYWGINERTAFDQWLRQGGRAFVAGANNFYKQVDLSADARGTPSRSMRIYLDLALAGSAVTATGSQTVSFSGNGAGGQWANTIPPGTMQVGQTVAVGSDVVKVTALQTDGSGNITGYTAVFGQTHLAGATHSFESDPRQLTAPRTATAIASHTIPGRPETLSQGNLYGEQSSATYNAMTLLANHPSYAPAQAILATLGLPAITPGAAVFEVLGHEFDIASAKLTSAGDTLVPGRLVPVTRTPTAGSQGTMTQASSFWHPLGGGAMFLAATFSLFDGVSNYTQAMVTTTHAALQDAVRAWVVGILEYLLPGFAVSALPAVTRPYAIGTGPSPSASPANTADYSTAITISTIAASAASVANASISSSGGSTALTTPTSGTVSDTWSLAAAGGSVTFTITPSADNTPVILTEYSLDGGRTWTNGTSFTIGTAGTYQVLVRTSNQALGSRVKTVYNTLIQA